KKREGRKGGGHKTGGEKGEGQKKAKGGAGAQGGGEKVGGEKKGAGGKTGSEKKKAAEKAAAEKKAAAAKAAAEKKAQEEAKLKALREAMRSDALGAAGMPGGTADRNQTGGGGGDGGYAAKVRACVRPRVVYNVPPRQGSANPTVQYRVQLESDGTVKNVTIRRS